MDLRIWQRLYFEELVAKNYSMGKIQIKVIKDAPKRVMEIHKLSNWEVQFLRNKFDSINPIYFDVKKFELAYKEVGNKLQEAILESKEHLWLAKMPKQLQ